MIELALFAVLGASPVAQTPLAARVPSLETRARYEQGLVRVEAHLTGASGPAFEWWATLEDPRRVPATPRFPVARATLDPTGSGRASVTVPRAVWVRARGGAGLFSGASFVSRGKLRHLPATPVEEPLGERLDFDWGLYGARQLSGAIVSDTQPWSRFMTISAQSHDPAHPDAAILLDSSDPPPGEESLRTPGTGHGNTRALGLVLVVARDLIDADGNGRVDEPHAEPSGGTLVFDFPGLTTVADIRLVDVDEPGCEVRLYDAGGLQYGYIVTPGEPNGVQEVFGGFGITRLEVELTGRAAIGELVLHPCLATIDFDHSSTGVPLKLPAGSSMYGGPAYHGLLIWFDALNNDPGHPDLPIVFDSARPTGGDTDLRTPGYGPGNTEALEGVLVIAEDDVDADRDGRVDDPDDEASGGVIRMNWYTSDAFFRGATVLDVDAYEAAWIEVYLNTGGKQVIPLQNLGDNSAQTVTADAGPTRRIEFHFTGSGALAEVLFAPEI